MATLLMMYPAKGGLAWGQMRGCYLKSGGLHPLGGLYNILRITSESALLGDDGYFTAKYFIELYVSRQHLCRIR